MAKAKGKGGAAVAEPEQQDEAVSEATEAQEEQWPEIVPVRAMRVGYYGNLRRYPAGYDHPRSGEIFELKPIKSFNKKTGKEFVLTAQQQFSEKWMERVTDDEATADARMRQRMPHKKAVITKTAADRSVI